MSLLTIPIVKNSRCLARIYFIFLKGHPRPNWKVPNMDLQEKIKNVVIM